MRVTLIHNPTAGDELFSANDLTAMIKAAGHAVLYQSSKGDYVSALEAPADLIAVAGGDGTVRKVAMRMIGHRIPIAVLPCGTANNIARSLGILRPALELIAGWPSARRKGIDVGVMSGPEGKIHFVEAMGLGIFSGAMSILNAIDEEYDIEFDDADQKLQSDIGALKAMVAEYPAFDATVTIDGRSFSGRHLLIEAMNIKSIGPNLQLAPEADAGDGDLDFVFVGENHREEMIDYLTERLRSEDACPRVTIHKGKHMWVTWEGSEVHVDDRIRLDEREKPASDSQRSMTIDVTLERSALEFLIP